jgi:hypothetical protein
MDTLFTIGEEQMQIILKITMAAEKIRKKQL